MYFFPLYFSQEWKLNQKFNLRHLVCVNSDLENDLVSLLEDQDQVSSPSCDLQQLECEKLEKTELEKFFLIIIYFICKSF